MVNSSFVVLAFIGDLMLGRGVDELIADHPAEHFWGTTLNTLRASDAVFANLECAIASSKTRRWSKTPKVFHFRASPKAVSLLKTANVQVVALANNHTLDFEEKGLLEMLTHLDDAGIRHAGAGRNQAEARAPAIVTVKGLKVGFISATDNEPVFAAGKDKPGTNYMRIDDEPDTVAHLKSDIAQAQSLGAQFIVLSLHWGPNMVQTPPENFQKFARKAIDLGVNMIHGHSAHIFQGIEFYKDGLILYDTGDFVDDYAIDPYLRNDWSFIFSVDLEGMKIKKVRLTPVQLSFGQTNLAEKRDAEKIISRMQRLSRAFGTKSEKVGDVLELYR